MAIVETSETRDPAAAAALSEGEAWSRQRTVVLAFGRRVNAAVANASLVDDAAALVAETLGVAYSSAALWNEATATLHLRLSHGGAIQRETAVAWSPEAPSIDTLSGHAMSRRETLSYSNLQNTSFRDGLLRTCGMRSGLVVPLATADRVLGALGVFDLVEREFLDHEIEFAETVSEMLSSTLGRLRAEEQLRDERRLASAMFDASDEPALQTDVEFRVMRVNRACVAALGYTSVELIGRSLWNAFAAPEAKGEAERLVRAAVRSRAAAEGVLPLKTRAGLAKPMTVTVRAVVDECQEPVSFVFTSTVPSSGRVEAPQSQASGDAQPFQQVQDAMSTARTSPRRAFPYRQRVAKFEAGRPPESLEFTEVQFEDISAGGVSFYFESRPDFEKVVLALGTAPNLHYIVAVVTSITALSLDRSRLFKIGCRFLDRW